MIIRLFFGWTWLIACTLAGSLVRAQPRDHAASACAALRNLRLPSASITTAERVTSGTFNQPGTTTSLSELPPFCRVAAVLTPSPDSHIRVELWLPDEKWNGRFLGTGTGGGAGYINYGSLGNGIRAGFATANTDMGTSPGANTLSGHSEKWTDFGHRATHEMTVVGKAVTKAYYAKTPHHAYFSGCSTGGQQALMEAQRYPDDYDGILAGAPANNRTHLHTGFIWNLRATNDETGSAFLPKGKIDLITKSVIQACAGKDGGAPGDNFLTDPRACVFDMERLPLCPDGVDHEGCLTSAQITALKKIYNGPVNPRTGERIYTPMPLGSENVGAGIEMQQDPEKSPQAFFYQHKWAFGPDFDYRTFDFDRDQDKLDSLLAGVLNANSTDLYTFKSNKAKLLMYAGTADPLVPYQDAAAYYERVVKAENGLDRTQQYFRFFLIPGMGHCSGGPGLNDGGDLLQALVDWREKGLVPEKIIANAYKNGDPKSGVRFRRPIYPYPLLPTYVSSDPTRPENFKPMAFPDRKVLVPAERYLE